VIRNILGNFKHFMILILIVHTYYIIVHKLDNKIFKIFHTYLLHGAESYRFATSQEIPCVLRNPKVHCRIHKWLPPVPFLSQINPVHASSSHFLQTHFNILLPSTSRSSEWSLSPWSPYQYCVCTAPVPYTFHAICHPPPLSP